MPIADRVGPIEKVRALVRAAYEETFLELLDVAACLAFYTVLALIPFLLLCVLLVGIVLDQRSLEAVGHLMARITPSAATSLIEPTLRVVAASARGGLLPVLVAIGAGVWTVSKVTAALVRSLNRVFRVTETRPYLYRRVLALIVTAAAGTLAAAAVLVEVALPFVLSRVEVPAWEFLRWVRLPVSGVLVMISWTALYRLLPSHPPRVGLPSAGAVLAVGAWLLATVGLSIYVEHLHDFGAIYGTFGGVIVLLLWLWISAFCLLGGAEVDRRLAERRQARSGATSPWPSAARKKPT